MLRKIKEKWRVDREGGNLYAPMATWQHEGRYTPTYSLMEMRGIRIQDKSLAASKT